MKTMMNRILLIAVLMATITVSAQRGPCYNGKGGYRLEELKETLQLTPDQEEKFDAIRDDFFNAKKEVFDDDELLFAERRDKVAQLRDEMDAALKDILDENQYNLWLEHRENFPGPGMGKKGRPFCGLMNDAPQEVMDLRKEFDSELTKEEKDLIAEVRETWKQNRQENGNGKGCCGRGYGNGPGTCMLPLQEILENHKARLDEIKDRIDDIMAENCPRHGEFGGRGPRGKHRGFRDNNMGFEERRIMHFLLMETDGTTISSQSGNDETLALFPNPVAGDLTIQFNNPSEGQVTIELLDKNGNILRTVDKSGRKAGDQTVVFNTEDLPSAEVYLIRVTGPGFSMAKKFVVK